MIGLELQSTAYIYLYPTNNDDHIQPKYKDLLDAPQHRARSLNVAIPSIYIYLEGYIPDNGRYRFRPSKTVKMKAELGAERSTVIPHPR